MAFVFYSETPCYFKIDGDFLGVVNKNPKILTDISNFCFMSFIPITKEFYPVETTLNDKCCLKVFTLFEDTVIIPLFDKKRNLPYKLICQKKFNLKNNSLLVTVIQDGFYKFYLDGAINYIDELPFSVEKVEIKEIQNKLFVVFYGIKSVIFAFDLNSNNLLYKNFLDEFTFADCFITSTLYNTLIPVTIIESWDYDFNLISRDFDYAKKPHDIHPKLLSIAFFELISLNVNLSFMLSENLKNREKDLHDFIGKPIAVFPYFNDINKTVVILNDSIHLYSLSFSSGLITNVLEE